MYIYHFGTYIYWSSISIVLCCLQADTNLVRASVICTSISPDLFRLLVPSRASEKVERLFTASQLNNKTVKRALTSMWLDRLSAHPTPSSSPAPRRPSHLGPGNAPRPGLSPRSSSLNLAKFNSSTNSLNSTRLPNGSGLKQQIIPPTTDLADPLKILEEIVGKKVPEGGRESSYGDAVKAALVEDIDFNGLSLYDFLHEEETGSIGGTHSVVQSAEECEYVRSCKVLRVLLLTAFR